MVNENDQQQQNQQQTKKSLEEMGKTLGDNFNDSNNKSENPDNLVDHMNNPSEDSNDLPTSSKGKLNDLVADLCLNGHDSTTGQRNQSNAHSIGGVYGDYTNIRATSGPIGINENNFPCSNNEASYVSTNSTSTHNVQQQQPPTQNSSFSFKHFLSSNNVPTAPSTTVTSLDPPANSTSITSSSNATTSSRSLQTSTGARPKVPQSSSVSSTCISSLTVGGAHEAQSSATKMKRSPRFSSFDSQASLAECASSSTAAGLAEDVSEGESSNAATDFFIFPDEKERDRFQEWNFPSNAPTKTTHSTDYDRSTSYVPRSYSNYDMPRPQTSPRRRVGIGAAAKDSRPTRLSLNANQNPTTAAKLKLDLPLTSNSSGGLSALSTRKNVHSNRPTDLQPSNSVSGGAAAAAALPDFVQDHWMDSWYANDMHVNSPPSSPIPTFIDDLTGSGQASCSSVGHAAGALHKHNTTNRTLHLDNAPIPGPADRGDFNIGLPELPSNSVGSKMLPDFLSDGPIIHSSQRLADVAAGLPSNSVGSPEESSINKQLSRLRSDNERMQRELNETRLALNVQTLRANKLERQLIEQQKQHKTETDESSDSNKKHTTAVQSHVAKLKQQIQQLTAEVDMLKRENELMREEGAVGGYTVQSCDRSYVAATVTNTTRISAASSAAAVAGSDITSVAGIRPSRQQQLSRDLRRAASNAEHNLKQLLAGVENLRQMAANIEKSETHIDYDASPDLFSDFIDECDDYDENPGGGPTL